MDGIDERFLIPFYYIISRKIQNIRLIFLKICGIIKGKGVRRMIRIAIVDDEPIMVSFIHKKIESIFNNLKIEVEMHNFTNGKSALKDIIAKSFDLVFLDIDMPDISGMNIANRIRLLDCRSEIVFITNKEDLVYDAVKLSPFRFIRKSQFDEEIYEAIDKFIEKINDSKSTYMFNSTEGKITVQLVKIRYIEVSSHKLFINSINRSFTVNGNLKDVEELFYRFGFIKIHQSYLVNYRYINLIKRKEVILDDESTIPLSRSNFEKVKIEYMKLSRGDW